MYVGFPSGPDDPPAVICAFATPSIWQPLFSAQWTARIDLNRSSEGQRLSGGEPPFAVQGLNSPRLAAPKERPPCSGLSCTQPQLAAPRMPTPRNSTLTFGSVRSMRISYQ